MGYIHIDNLYKNQTILMFKECWALEKIHGTSAHIGWKDETIRYFSGGEKYPNFVDLFNEEELKTKFTEFGAKEVIVYGEAYGGKQQGMKDTYGNELKFVAFDVKVGNCWLNVPSAEKIVKHLGLEFVWYTKVSTNLVDLDAVRDRWSEQAIRNGITEKKIMEGVVLRPLIELKRNNGERIIAKHKRDEFRETRCKRKVITPEKQKIWEGAKETANEWVTNMRLTHVLDKIPNHSILMLGKIIGAMIEDIKREGEGEIKWSKELNGAIGRKTAEMYKRRWEDAKGEIRCRIKEA